MLQGNLWLAKSRDTGTTIGPFASSADWRFFGGYCFDLTGAYQLAFLIGVIFNCGNLAIICKMIRDANALRHIG